MDQFSQYNQFLLAPEDNLFQEVLEFADKKYFEAHGIRVRKAPPRFLVLTNDNGIVGCCGLIHGREVEALQFMDLAPPGFCLMTALRENEVREGAAYGEIVSFAVANQRPSGFALEMLSRAVGVLKDEGSEVLFLVSPKPFFEHLRRAGYTCEPLGIPDFHCSSFSDEQARSLDDTFTKRFNGQCAMVRLDATT